MTTPTKLIKKKRKLSFGANFIITETVSNHQNFISMRKIIFIRFALQLRERERPLTRSLVNSYTLLMLLNMYFKQGCD